MSDKHATLNLTHEDGTEQAIDLSVHSGSLGPDVVDVGKLTANGYFTYDPGFTSTAACESQITFIDGEKGVLLHRGYPITGRTLGLSRDLLFAAQRRTAHGRAERGVCRHHDPPHDGS